MKTLLAPLPSSLNVPLFACDAGIAKNHLLHRDWLLSRYLIDLILNLTRKGSRSRQKIVKLARKIRLFVGEKRGDVCSLSRRIGCKLRRIIKKRKKDLTNKLCQRILILLHSEKCWMLSPAHQPPCLVLYLLSLSPYHSRRLPAPSPLSSPLRIPLVAIPLSLSRPSTRHCRD
ncbi:hypothetical protein PUN28_019034 [Cardiocondyla obscurior]|uniref:Uncharacterized protein n=1 Tax=Cardiocondyla obscurior TaxID=286306 RepID=A0AAW2EIJ3_9HYME